MKRSIFIITVLLITISARGQRVAENTYWFYFTDKDQNGYTITHPEEFLSQRSIDRRAWQSLSIDESDLPVTSAYVDSLSALGLEVLYISKWLNGALVRSNNVQLIDTLHHLSFIDSLKWKSQTDELYYPELANHNRFFGPLEIPPSYKYGYSFDQINLLKLQALHDKGFTGKGVLVAVLDAGFINLPELPAFQRAIANGQILKTKNFVNKGMDIYNSHSHGTNVTSTIVSNWPDSLMGTAPDVDLILAVTENPDSETRIEEYSWIEAAEWVDSIGADIINTSLGYTTFDDSTTNYSYKDMDGKTAHISIANSMTASKGMISVTSAGNSGSDDWYYIGAPADATNILTVGAVKNTGELSSFSSRGPTYDHRIKPEIAAMGSLVAVQSTDGSVALSAGTSFSSPIIAGATAVLWQAYPSMSSFDLMQWIIESGNRAGFPNVEYGYGIPSFRKAYYAITSLEINNYSDTIKVYPNPFSTYINIEFSQYREARHSIILYDIQGRMVFSDQVILPGRIDLPTSLHRGIYLMEISGSQSKHRTPLIKY